MKGNVPLLRRGSLEKLNRRKGRPSVKVELQNGKALYADHVICTVPLGRNMDNIP